MHCFSLYDTHSYVTKQVEFFDIKDVQSFMVVLILAVPPTNLREGNRTALKAQKKMVC